MLDIFRKKEDLETPRRLQQLHTLLRSSFNNVKRDTCGIFQWLNYLYQKSVQQDQLIQDLYTQIQNRQDIKSEISLALEDYHKTNSLQIKQHIKEIIDNYYYLDGISTQIANLNHKINALSLQNSNLSPQLEDLKSRIMVLEQKKQDIKTNLKEKLLKKITKNSKDYIKNLVISLIRKYGKISGYQLKEMIVEEQGLCSKSSFYRILAELEESPDINMLWEGKEKVFFSKLTHVNEK